MSDYLKLGKKLTQFSHNPDRQGEHKYRKIDGKFVVEHRVSGQIVATFDNEHDRNLFFYDKSEVDFSFSILRNNVFLEENTSLQDVYDWIESDQTLKRFINNLYCFENRPKEPVTLKKSGEIVDGVFKIKYYNTPAEKFSLDKKFTLNDTITEDCFTLYDMFRCLFGVETKNEAELTKKGVLFNNQIVEPMSYLNHVVHIEDEFTLGDLFNFVGNHPELVEFFKQYSWCRDLEQFHLQAKEITEKKRDLWHLEVYRHGSIYKESIDYGAEFHGVGELSDDEKSYYDDNPLKKRPNHTNYSVSCSHMNNLVHLPLFLNEELQINYYGKLFKAEKTEIYKTQYTLLELIDAVYWDISFYGGPEQAEEFKKEIEERVENYLENGL